MSSRLLERGAGSYPWRHGALVKGVLLGLALLAPGSPLLGQGAGEGDLGEMGERISLLRDQLRGARRAADLADSVRADSLKRANQVPLDTITVGPLRVVALPEQVGLAREVFQSVWEGFRPLVRGSEEVLSSQLFIFRYAWRFDGMYLEGEGVHSVEMSRRFGRDRLESKARDRLGFAILSALPEGKPGLRWWIGNRSLATGDDWSWIYRDLAASPSAAAHRCFRGDIPWCWEAMGVSRQEEGWINWYTPEERRILVEAKRGYRLRMDRVRWSSPYLLVHGCVVLESDRACLEILREFPSEIPLGTAARASLAALALRKGGEGAFSRLAMASGEGIREQLAAAAGIPADSLMSLWQARVLQEKPRLHADLLQAPLSLLFWVFLLTLAARRSTSWRLG